MTIKNEDIYVRFLDALLDAGGNIARACRSLCIARVDAFRWVAQSQYTPEKFEFEYGGKRQALHMHMAEMREISRMAAKFNNPEPEAPIIDTRTENEKQRDWERAQKILSPKFVVKPPDKTAKRYSELHNNDPQAEHAAAIGEVLRGPSFGPAPEREVTDAELLGEAPLPDDDVVEVAPEPASEPAPPPPMSPRALQAWHARRKIEARVANGGRPMTPMERALIAELEEPEAARTVGGQMPWPRVVQVPQYQSDDDKREKIGAGTVFPGGQKLR